MTTWNYVTIEAPGAVDCVEIIDLKEYWDACDERVSVPAHKLYPGSDYTVPEYVGKPDGDITIQGESKYHDDELDTVLVEFSTANPDVTISWHETWDDDGNGETVTVYRAGEQVREESQHSEMVPDILSDLVTAVREALPAEGAFDPAMTLTAATRALCDALRPIRVQVSA